MSISVINNISVCSLGYEGVHKQREAEYYNEGEATFFKTSRFEVMETEASSFSKLLQKVTSLLNTIGTVFNVDLH